MEQLMKSYKQFTLAAARLIAVLAVLVPGAGSAAAGASFAPCDMRLQVELSADVPDPSDAKFLSSLLSYHRDYRLTFQRQNPESAFPVTLDLAGPGPEAGCREVVDSLRRDARVVSIEVQPDASTTEPAASTVQPESAHIGSTVQQMGTVRAGPDGDWILEPLNGVSYAQQARDRYECDIQAVDQIGFDPAKDDGGALPNVRAKRVDYLRAEAACLQARGYVVVEGERRQ
jgi:hypothetical protein